MAKLTLDKLDVSGKRVLMRVDFNVPLDKDGNVRDDERIRAAAPSVRHVLDNGGSLVLMSHLGRPRTPDSATNEQERKAIEIDNQLLRMDKVAQTLSDLLGEQVVKSDEVVGPKAEAAVKDLQPGGVVLLENTRFHPGETKNDPELSKALAAFGDVYVSDAFGTVHRAHASTVGVTQFIQPCAAGFLLAREIEYFERILHEPDRPFIAVLGGAKVSDKIQLLENLLDRVDKLIIGGAMAYTFLKALGQEIGDSVLDEKGLDTAKVVLKKAEEKQVPVLLPKDHIVADAFDPFANARVEAKNITPGWRGMDIGPDTIAEFCAAIREARTVVWNGPMGVFEMQAFEKGTRMVLTCLAEHSCLSVIGGGDTAAAVRQFGLSDRMSHVSTGGGASLEMLEGKELPGIAALTDAS